MKNDRVTIRVAKPDIQEFSRRIMRSADQRLVRVEPDPYDKDENHYLVTVEEIEPRMETR